MMRTLLALLAVVLLFGAYFSGGEPTPDPEKPGCPFEACGCQNYFEPLGSSHGPDLAEMSGSQ